MSSQPNTPQPTATPPPPTTIPQEVAASDTTTNNHYPPSPPLPLETQKHDMVTPAQPPRRSRKESYTDQCPSFGPVMYLQNVFSLDRHTW
jgi:hypothetical protein